jgi:hypothetical protein
LSSRHAITTSSATGRGRAFRTLRLNAALVHFDPCG